MEQRNTYTMPAEKMRAFLFEQEDQNRMVRLMTWWKAYDVTVKQARKIVCDLAEQTRVRVVFLEEELR